MGSEEGGGEAEDEAEGLGVVHGVEEVAQRRGVGARRHLVEEEVGVERRDLHGHLGGVGLWMRLAVDLEEEDLGLLGGELGDGAGDLGGQGGGRGS